MFRLRPTVLALVLIALTAGACGDNKKPPSDASIDCLQKCNEDFQSGSEEHRQCILKCPPS